ncbi:MAG TPA: hypothetical protein PLM07_01405 [Candidatus Rifleibacterium sp.]|nr:hypothetical protein [Candidatus Rifleibacterium sp.]
MGGFRVGFLVLVFITLLAFVTGCFSKNDDAPAFSPVPAVLPEPLTSVRFAIALPPENISLRAATGDVPQVFFELRLLDRAGNNPVVMLRKQAQVLAGDAGFVASANFANVPVLPAIASMSIVGGYLADTNNKPFKIWVGRKDLVAASENIITLTGSGDKSPTDVAVNLLNRLIAVPANVAALALPIFATVDAIIATLDLNASTVYDDAFKAYNDAYGVIGVPADAEFQPPAAYASLAFPTKNSSVSLVMPKFAAASEAWVVLMNRSASTLTPTWSVPKAGSLSLRPSHADNGGGAVDNETAITPGQRFQLFLRKYRPIADHKPSFNRNAPLLRQSLRAVAINDSLTFKAYLSGTNSIGNVSGKCVRIAEHANGRKTFFFLDVDDTALTGIENVLTGAYDAWRISGGIYEKNRLVFGEEPPGTLNSQNLEDYNQSDLYILISRKIFTAGYFWSADLFPDRTDANHKKIFFVQLHADISATAQVINDLSATMAHEFQHMIHYWQKRKLAEADPWLEEAMSGYAEHANGYQIQNQKNQSKALQANYYFSRMSAVKIDKWHLDSDSSQVVSAYYGKAFLFGVWLAQNYGTDGSVQNLLAVQSTEKAAVEAFTGETFDKTFAKFMLAMAVNDSNGGTFGFKGLDLTLTYSFGSDLAVTLTGPAKQLISIASAGSSGNSMLAPYTAAYIKIASGDSTNVAINATLPTGVSLFHLQK